MSRCSSVRIGVEDPPGVQNLSLCPSRIPPARSSSWRSVMPRGASYWPGLVTCPDRLNRPWHLERSVPIESNQPSPSRTMPGTEAIDSTLFTTVGRAYRPATAGNRSEEHTSELQSRFDLVCRLLLEKKKKNKET